MTDEIPGSSMNTLQELADATTIKIELLKQDYIKYYEALKDEPQFTGRPEDLTRYLDLKIRAKYQSRSPALPRQIIPVGMDQIRKSKDSESVYSALYVIDKNKKIRRVAFNGAICDVLREIQIFYPYKDVALAEIGRDSGDFLADDRSEFTEYVDKKLSDDDVFALTKAKKVTLRDILMSDKTKLNSILSRVDSKGWPVKTDWRAIHGQIQNIKMTDDEKEGTCSGWMTLIDDTINISKELFDKKGKKLNKNIRIWINPLVAPTLTKYSEAWAFGPLGVNKKTGEVSMNGFCILPTFISPIMED